MLIDFTCVKTVVNNTFLFVASFQETFNTSGPRNLQNKIVCILFIAAVGMSFATKILDKKMIGFITFHKFQFGIRGRMNLRVCNILLTLLNHTNLY